MPKKIETFANLATIVAATLLSVALVRVYLVPSLWPRNSIPVPPAGALIGTNLKNLFPAIDWKKNDRTLVLAISTHCHFCTESTPFFRRLGVEVQRSVKVVALLPEPVDDAERYLNSEGVRVDQVKQVALGSLGIQGTPTMLLVDSKGIVKDIWLGKLDPQEQDEALLTLLDPTHKRKPIRKSGTAL
jgi:hypothetical protein